LDRVPNNPRHHQLDHFRFAPNFTELNHEKTDTAKSLAKLFCYIGAVNRPEQNEIGDLLRQNDIIPD
jgi:hypothetical protein